ncbi:hypothetical protein EOA23_27305, partial [Mesorhizobium sp. M2A.F.Ca.ET.042.01.1.1]
VHRDIAGTVAGIPFSVQRGLHARFMLDVVGDGTAGAVDHPSSSVGVPCPSTSFTAFLSKDTKVSPPSH